MSSIIMSVYLHCFEIENKSILLYYMILSYENKQDG